MTAPTPAHQALAAKRERESAALKKAEETIIQWQEIAKAHAAKIKVINEIMSEMAAGSATDTPALNGLGKYATMKIQDGILDILSQPGTSPMSPPRIAERLKAEGAQSTSPNFRAIVATQCKRLKERGKLVKTPDGYKLTKDGFIVNLLS